MDFKPFDVPPSDYHPLATGLGDEGGVTPRNLVAGINAYLAHLFAAIEGKVPKMIKSGEADLSSLRRGAGAMVISAEDDIVKLIGRLSDRIAKLEHDVAMLEDLLTSAKSTPQAPIQYAGDGSHPQTITPAPVEPDIQGMACVDPVDESDSPQPPNSLAALLAATGGGKAG